MTKIIYIKHLKSSANLNAPACSLQRCHCGAATCYGWSAQSGFSGYCTRVRVCPFDKISFVSRTAGGRQKMPGMLKMIADVHTHTHWNTLSHTLGSSSSSYSLCEDERGASCRQKGQCCPGVSQNLSAFISCVLRTISSTISQTRALRW